MNAFEIIFLFSSFVGCCFGIFFLIKEKGDKMANGILGVYMIAFAYNIGFNSLYWSKLLYTETFIHLLGTNVFPWLLYGPLFYIYVRRVINKKGIRLHDSFHLLPVFIYIASKLSFYFLPATKKLTLVFNGDYLNYGISTMDTAKFAMVQMFIYGILALKISFKNTRELNRNKKIWLQFLVGAFMGYWTVFVIYFVRIPLGLYSVQSDYIICFFILFFIGGVSYFGFMQPDVFNGLPMHKVVPFIKYKKTGLTKAHSIELKDRLEHLMLNEKPFLDNNLRLEDLAKLLNLSRHHMSQIINEQFDVCFFDYVNQHRVTEAIELLISNEDNLNITQVAYSAGFNNRVSFYKAFKKVTGTTPSDFIIIHSNRVS